MYKELSRYMENARYREFQRLSGKPYLFIRICQENECVTSVELFTELCSLIPSEFFMVTIITLTDLLYQSAKQCHTTAIQLV